MRDAYRLYQLKRLIDPKVILDFGGHVGIFSLMAKKLWPDALLIAVEPVKEACSIFKRNMIDNGFKRYHILNCALSYDPEKKYLAEDIRNPGGGMLTSKKDLKDIFDFSKGFRVFNPEPVETITIEEIIKRFGIESIDLAKWDIGGYEKECWEKMSDEAAARFKYMVGEFHIHNRNKGSFDAHQKEKSEYWEIVQSKFPHLTFYNYAELVGVNLQDNTYNRSGIGIFEAIPKGQGEEGQEARDFIY